MSHELTLSKIDVTGFTGSHRCRIFSVTRTFALEHQELHIHQGFMWYLYSKCIITKLITNSWIQITIHQFTNTIQTEIKSLDPIFYSAPRIRSRLRKSPSKEVWSLNKMSKNHFFIPGLHPRRPALYSRPGFLTSPFSNGKKPHDDVSNSPVPSAIPSELFSYCLKWHHLCLDNKPKSLTLGAYGTHKTTLRMKRMSPETHTFSVVLNKCQYPFYRISVWLYYHYWHRGKGGKIPVMA